MDNTPESRIIDIKKSQKEYFNSGVTKDLKFRKIQLAKFAQAMTDWEERLSKALWHDLHKSYEEAYLTEICLVKAEIREAKRHLKRWARRERKASTVAVMPSASYVIKEPLGNTLIISPWNYPVQLLLSPLVGAISAGCTAVLKPSPYVPEVSRVICEMISETFDECYIAAVQGNRDVNTVLLNQRWDLIFFTGSPALAKTVMAAAAKNLTPLVLELGGKSPCIINKDADLKIAARRLAWGKTLNSGQTCIAPDYILIHEDVQDAFVNEFANAVKELHGNDIEQSGHYVRMVREQAFDRVAAYMNCGEVVYGGHADRETRFIEPTLMKNVPTDSPLMTEEIFGPIFPMITIHAKEGDFLEQTAHFVNEREKPLAFYYFGKEKDGWDIIGRTSSGGACINDAIMHIVNPNVPFGGVGNSGMGHYHNKESFEAFSHRRSVIASPTWIDLPFRYMPYKLFPFVKNLL